MSLAPEMAHHRQWPGLERRDAGSGAVSYTGTREAFEASDLLPLGTPYPGEIPGARGSRWTDGEGRRHVLAKARTYKVHTFRLRVYPTTAERLQHEERDRVGRATTRLQSELAALETGEQEFRNIFERMLCMAAATTKQLMASDTQPWRYEPHVLEEFDALVGQLLALVAESPLQQNTAALTTAKARHAALTDDSYRRTMLRVISGAV